MLIAFTVGVGLTAMVKVCGVPEQDVLPFVNVGVTVMVATTVALLTFVAEKEAILPVPEAERPILVVLFVQA